MPFSPQSLRPSVMPSGPCRPRQVDTAAAAQPNAPAGLKTRRVVPAVLASRNPRSGRGAGSSLDRTEKMAPFGAPFNVPHAPRPEGCGGEGKPADRAEASVGVMGVFQPSGLQASPAVSHNTGLPCAGGPRVPNPRAPPDRQIRPCRAGGLRVPHAREGGRNASRSPLAPAANRPGKACPDPGLRDLASSPATSAGPASPTTPVGVSAAGRGKCGMGGGDGGKWEGDFCGVGGLCKSHSMITNTQVSYMRPL